MKFLIAVAAVVGINGIAKSIMKSGSIQASAYMLVGKMANSLVPFWATK